MKLVIVSSGFRLRTVLTGLLVIYNFSFGQIKVDSDGRIGIGTLTPTADLEIDAPQVIMKNGNSLANLKIQYLYGNSVVMEPTVNNNGYLGYNNNWMQVKTQHLYYFNDHYYSDSRIKEDVKDLKNSLSKVLQMNGVKYKLKREFYSDEEFPDGNGKRNECIGFIAQDLLKIVPEAVSYDSTAKLYAISYTRIVPLLVEAIKEMNIEFENLQYELDELRLKLAKISEREINNITAANSVGIDIQSGTESSFLEQNQPNPFEENTTISFYLNPAVQNASLCLFDVQGRQVKNVRIRERGNGNLSLDASELKPGIYYYSLVADDIRIGTRQMILTD